LYQQYQKFLNKNVQFHGTKIKKNIEIIYLGNTTKTEFRI
jgi:hypothetical protein